MNWKVRSVHRFFPLRHCFVSFGLKIHFVTGSDTILKSSQSSLDIKSLPGNPISNSCYKTSIHELESQDTGQKIFQTKLLGI